MLKVSKVETFTFYYHFPTFLFCLFKSLSPVWYNLHKVQQISQYSTTFSSMKALGVFHGSCFPVPLTTSKCLASFKVREAVGSLMLQHLQPINTKALMLLRTRVRILMLISPLYSPTFSLAHLFLESKLSITYEECMNRIFYVWRLLKSLLH